MKEQHSVLYLKNEDGTITDFERFSCKTLRGVLNSYKRLVAANQASDGTILGMAGYFLKGYRKAHRIEIWETYPNGNPVRQLAGYSGSEFLEEITR